MARYVRRPPTARLYVEDHIFPDESPMLPSVSVDDHEPVNTGLLWEDGSPVWRAPNPIGFGRDGEWM
jgi:hypothetical protein